MNDKVEPYQDFKKLLSLTIKNMGAQFRHPWTSGNL